MPVRVCHLGILVITAASISSWYPHGTVSAVLRTSFRRSSDSKKFSTTSPVEDVVFESETEEDEEEGSYNGASSTADIDGADEFTNDDESSTKKEGSDYGEEGSADDVLSEESAIKNQEEAPAVTSEFDELDTLLQSAGLDSKFEADATTSSSSGDSEGLGRVGSSGIGSGTQDSLSTTAATTATIADMKAILRAAGIAPAKLDSFLDRESLVDYFAAYQKLHKQRQHLASATDRSATTSSSSSTTNAGRSDTRSNHTQHLHQNGLIRQGGWQPPTEKPPKAPSVAKARVEGPPKSVVLLGEQHSGVAWVAELFHLNAPGWKVQCDNEGM